MPLGYGVQWLPLEERFALYGGGITAIGVGLPTHLAEPAALVDPTTPAHGPFSKDFRWVTVPEIQQEPIPLTKTQGAVFEALWSFKGQPQLGSQIMKRAGSRSDVNAPSLPSLFAPPLSGIVSVLHENRRTEDVDESRSGTGMVGNAH